jgi:phenylacetate-CoA ligase
MQNLTSVRQPLDEGLRHPLLTEAGRRLLDRLQEHNAAPRYNFACGDQLDAATLERVKHYETNLYSTPYQSDLTALTLPMQRFVQRCIEQVPKYRRYSGLAWTDVPTLSRADIQNAPWELVPDDEPLAPMMAYDSSGTMGSKLWVMSHPFVSSAFLAILRHALNRHGVHLEGGPGRVAIAMVSFQDHTLTFATVTSFLQQAGYVKLNLNPTDWKDPADRARFLDDCQPEIFTGSPVAFAELARLPLQHRPKALVSTSLALLPGLRAELEGRFGCPVLDMYSMCEGRAVAAGCDENLVVMRPDVHVEVLDEAGHPCAAGIRGEVTVTSSLNPFLPLLRYRTGDYARLSIVNGLATLADFQGRAPTLFEAANGDVVNNIDVTIAIRHLPLVQVEMLQKADRSLSVRYRGDVSQAKLQDAIRKRLGDLPMTFEPVTAPLGTKGLQYRRDR